MEGQRKALGVTTAELAQLTDLSQRTIRRYARNHILSPTRGMMGNYRFSADDIDAALIARDRNLRRLELTSPGLVRHIEMRRKRQLSEGGLMADRRPIGQGLAEAVYGDYRGQSSIICPRCKHSFRTAW